MAGVWTNNWANMRRAWACDLCTTDVGAVYNTNGQALNLTNLMSGSNAGPMSPLRSSSSPNAGSVSVVFGTSDTTPAVTDYSLGEAFASGLSYLSATAESTSYNAATATRTRRDNVVVQNTAAADKIVREWGIVGACGGQYVLLYRAVLDEPITLPQYYSLKLTITRTMQLEVLE